MRLPVRLQLLCSRRHAECRWVSESPARVGAVLERFQKHYDADAVQFHDMDFFISEPRTLAITERLSDWA